MHFPWKIYIFEVIQLGDAQVYGIFLLPKNFLLEKLSP